MNPSRCTDISPKCRESLLENGGFLGIPWELAGWSSWALPPPLCWVPVVSSWWCYWKGRHRKVSWVTVALLFGGLQSQEWKAGLPILFSVSIRMCFFQRPPGKCGLFLGKLQCQHHQSCIFKIASYQNFNLTFWNSGWALDRMACGLILFQT